MRTHTMYIDYRAYAEDYSEKALKLTFKEHVEDEGTRTAYIPKSILDEEGNLPMWFIAEQIINFPCYTDLSMTERDIMEEEKYLKKLEEGLPALIGTEREAKRRRNIESSREDIAELKKKRDIELKAITDKMLKKEKKK